jgi:hypothetical protein
MVILLTDIWQIVMACLNWQLLTSKVPFDALSFWPIIIWLINIQSIILATVITSTVPSDSYVFLTTVIWLIKPWQLIKSSLELATMLTSIVWCFIFWPIVIWLINTWQIIISSLELATLLANSIYFEPLPCLAKWHLADWHLADCNGIVGIGNLAHKQCTLRSCDSLLFWPIVIWLLDVWQIVVGSLKLATLLTSNVPSNFLPFLPIVLKMIDV